MEKTSHSNNFVVISTGVLADNFDKSTVIKNLCTRFSISETTANKLLKPKAIIKKGISESYAGEYKQQLTKLGLLVATIKANNSAQDKSISDLKNIKLPESVKDFESLFKADVPKVKISVKYKLGLLLVIFASLLAPLIYLGIMSGLVISLISYINSLPGILESTSNFTAIIGAIIIPVFIPLVLLLFLIKPLFISHHKPSEYILQRKQFPALFNLVKVMCNKIGVPVPAEISINNEINASASSQHGFISLLRGKLKLTVGLPLITGMNIRQFTGILAHEFGHFAQPTAMAAYYMVNTINFWFANRAYEPDEWDERLESWSDNADWHFVITTAIMGAQLGILLTRKLFSLLFLINYKTTQFMSRHMEYDADIYESIFSGSHQFEHTAIQLRKLAYADQDIQEVNLNAWNESKLLNNLPQAIASTANSYDSDIDEYIKQDMLESKTNSWDSHPADNDRISHVQKRNDPGIIMNDFPASHLCKNINQLSQHISLFAYRQMGFDKPENYVTENSTILNTNNEKKKARQSLDSFFNNSFNGRILNFASLSDRSHIPTNLNETINSLRPLLVDYNRNNDQLDHLSEKLSIMTMGQVYINSGIDLDIKNFYLGSKQADQVRASIDSTREELRKLSEKLHVTDQLFFHRLKFDARLMNQSQLKLLKNKLTILKQIEKISDKLSDLKLYHSVLDALSSNEEDLLESLDNSINRYGKFCFEESWRILKMTKNIPHENKDFGTLHNFIKSWCEDIPVKHIPDESLSTLRFSSNISGAIFYYYYWLLADVCELALSVETKNNVMPIKLA